MSDFMKRISDLADDIGPRPANTEEEKQAAELIASWFAEAHVAPEIEEFRCPTMSTWPYLVCYALMFLAALLSRFQGIAMPIMFLVALVALGVFVYERYLNGKLGRLFKGGYSQNVIAKYTPPHLDERRPRKRKIVILAHYDSDRAAIEASPFIVDRYPLVQKVILYSMMAIPVLLLLRLLPIPDGGKGVLWVLAFIVSLVPLVSLAAVLINRFVMQYPDGANDNASGVAAMMEIFDRIISSRTSEDGIRLMGELPPEPEVHDAQTAYDADVVPDGATVVYDEEEEHAETPEAGDMPEEQDAEDESAEELAGGLEEADEAAEGEPVPEADDAREDAVDEQPQDENDIEAVAAAAVARITKQVTGSFTPIVLDEAVEGGEQETAQEQGLQPEGLEREPADEQPEEPQEQAAPDEEDAAGQTAGEEGEQETAEDGDEPEPAAEQEQAEEEPEEESPEDQLQMYELDEQPESAELDDDAETEVVQPEEVDETVRPVEQAKPQREVAPTVATALQAAEEAAAAAAAAARAAQAAQTIAAPEVEPEAEDLAQTQETLVGGRRVPDWYARVEARRRAHDAQAPTPSAAVRSQYADLPTVSYSRHDMFDDEVEQEELVEEAAGWYYDPEQEAERMRAEASRKSRETEAKRPKKVDESVRSVFASAPMYTQAAKKRAALEAQQQEASEALKPGFEPEPIEVPGEPEEGPVEVGGVEEKPLEDQLAEIPGQESEADKLAAAHRAAGYDAETAYKAAVREAMAREAELERSRKEAPQIETLPDEALEEPIEPAGSPAYSATSAQLANQMDEAAVDDEVEIEEAGEYSARTSEQDEIDALADEYTYEPAFELDDSIEPEEPESASEPLQEPLGMNEVEDEATSEFEREGVLEQGVSDAAKVQDGPMSPSDEPQENAGAPEALPYEPMRDEEHSVIQEFGDFASEEYADTTDFDMGNDSYGEAGEDDAYRAEPGAASDSEPVAVDDSADAYAPEGELEPEAAEGLQSGEDDFEDAADSVAAPAETAGFEPVPESGFEPEGVSAYEPEVEAESVYEALYGQEPEPMYEPERASEPESAPDSAFEQEADADAESDSAPRDALGAQTDYDQVDGWSGAEEDRAQFAGDDRDAGEGALEVPEEEPIDRTAEWEAVRPLYRDGSGAIQDEPKVPEDALEANDRTMEQPAVVAEDAAAAAASPQMTMPEPRKSRFWRFTERRAEKERRRAQAAVARYRLEREQEAAAEVERFAREQEAAAEAERLAREQEAAAEAERLTREQEAAAEVERIAREQEAAAGGFAWQEDALAEEAGASPYSQQGFEPYGEESLADERYTPADAAQEPSEYARVGDDDAYQPMTDEYPHDAGQGFAAGEGDAAYTAEDEELDPYWGYDGAQEDAEGTSYERDQESAEPEVGEDEEYYGFEQPYEQQVWNTAQGEPTPEAAWGDEGVEPGRPADDVEDVNGFAEGVEEGAPYTYDGEQAYDDTFDDNQDAYEVDDAYLVDDEMAEAEEADAVEYVPEDEYMDEGEPVDAAGTADETGFEQPEPDEYAYDDDYAEDDGYEEGYYDESPEGDVPESPADDEGYDEQAPQDELPSEPDEDVYPAQREDELEDIYAFNPDPHESYGSQGYSDANPYAMNEAADMEEEAEGYDDEGYFYHGDERLDESDEQYYGNDSGASQGIHLSPDEAQEQQEPSPLSSEIPAFDVAAPEPKPESAPPVEAEQMPIVDERTQAARRRIQGIADPSASQQGVGRQTQTVRTGTIRAGAGVSRRDVLRNLPMIEGGSPGNARFKPDPIGQASPVVSEYANTPQRSGNFDRAAFSNKIPRISPEGSGRLAPIVDGAFAEGQSGAFVPVGDGAAYGSPGALDDDMYVADADDSYAGAAASLTGEFRAPVPTEIPHGRKSRFGHRRKSRRERRMEKREAEEWRNNSPSEWLGVDKDYNATREGAQIGSWDNFEEDDEWKGGASSNDYAYLLEEEEAMRESVEDLALRNLLNKEVWFVALGANSADHAGARDFIERHASELRGALFINLDSVGAGDLHYLTQEGTGLYATMSDRRLQSLAKKAVRETEHTIAAESMPYRSTDATPIIRAGQRALTFMGLDDKEPVAWRQTDDMSDIVEPEKIEAIVDIITEMVRKS